MNENLTKRNKIMKILNSGKYQFTEQDIEALSEICGGEKRSEHAVNKEQAYYDTLHTYTDVELIERARELFLSRYNKELEYNMIQNLLIYRGIDTRRLDITVDEYHRFMKNNREENERYML